MTNRYDKEMLARQGYSENMIKAWMKRVNSDLRNYKSYTKEQLDEVHSRGYLANSIKRYDLLNKKDCKYITDFDYIFLRPYNNNFYIWVQDINTTNKILFEFEEYCRTIYFSIVKRSHRNLILKSNEVNEVEYSAKDVLELIEEKGKLELRPSMWKTSQPRYILSYKESALFVNDKETEQKELDELIQSLTDHYIIADVIDYSYHDNINFYMNFYIANDYADNSSSKILDSYVYAWEENKYQERTISPISDMNGTFNFKEEQYQIDNYDAIKEKVKEIASTIKHLAYFLVSIAPKEDGFTIVYFSTKPDLPYFEFSDTLNEYLKEKVQNARIRQSIGHKREKKEVVVCEDEYNEIQDILDKNMRPGMREYMQSLWLDMVKKDFKETDATLEQKRWALEKGFFSYRIKEYNLTEENYQHFISDYDYMWLNRINNMYHSWVNDKTTFRISLQPFKDYVSKYYYSIYQDHGKMSLVKMFDCADKYSADIDGVIELLKDEKKLALKASAGTHGDGFYYLAYDDTLFVNGREVSEQYIKELINGFDLFYIVTEYIEAHDFISRFHRKSLNTIRINVINKNGYNPSIVQSYIRIGTSKTGFIDNVLHGGLCAMIDIATGNVYKSEMLKNNTYSPCDIHPDSGVKIEGVVPHWSLITNKVLEICKYYPELEYLGFDIAVTPDAFKIVEINIHPDLINVLNHRDDFKEFLVDKLRAKKLKYGLID